VNQCGATAALNANDASMIGVGYVYDLSRRTALYARAAHIAHKGASFFTLSGGPSASAASFGGQGSTGYEVGVRHSF